MSRARDPYIVGLRLLGTREFSSARLADRLRRRGFAEDEVARALDRLRVEGALDDGRAARAFTETFLRRGRASRRVLRDVEAQGIDTATAQEAVHAAFATLDEDDLMREVVARRVTGPIQDRAELNRLHRFLVRRGFRSSDALAMLLDHTSPSAAEGD